VSLPTRQTTALSAVTFVILFIAGVVWKIQGISLFLSLMTVHDALREALKHINVIQHIDIAQIVAGLLALFLFISEIFKPTFSRALEKYMPSWAAKLVFLAMVSVVMLIPVEGLAVLLQQIGGLLVSILALVFTLVAQHISSEAQGAAAAVATAVVILLYTYIIRVVSTLITKPRYDMWTSSLISLGLGYVGGLFFGVFAIMGYNIIKSLLGTGTGTTVLLFEIIAIALAAEAVSEAWRQAPRLDVRSMLWLPAVNIILLAVRDVFGPYAWIVDVLQMLFVLTGVGAVLWGVIMRNPGVYIAGCAYCAALLATYSVFEQAVQQATQAVAV
jgi:hypothetical protein